MDKKQWYKKIVKACKSAGTYEKYFETVIDTLSGIMEDRDITEKLYRESGSQPVIVEINKAGAEYYTKNPCLTVLQDLNKSALSYWRDLGLTPAGYKKLNDKAVGAMVKSLDDL